MKKRKLFDFRKILTLLMAAGACYLCLRYAQECAEGIRQGILFCIEVLVPSLFLFMALSAWLVKSGIAELLSQPLGGVSRALFGLPAAGMTALLLSMIGGYPVGARCAVLLYEQGRLNRTEAEKAVYIAVCAGPGFLLNYVGTALLHNYKAGILLLTAQTVGVLLTGILVGKAIPAASPPQRSEHSKHGHGQLIAAVSDASKATFHMCAMVVLCSAMIEVAATVSPSPIVTDIAAATLEITTGCERLCGRYPLHLIGFFIGFGGVSVHLQIYAGLGTLEVRKDLFFLFRTIQGIITAATTYILLMIFPVEQSVFNSTDAPLTIAQSATLVGSAALVLSSLCFIGSIHQKAIRR